MTRPRSTAAVPIALAAALLAPAGPAAAAQWDKVGETPMASVFVDKDSIRRNGNEVRAALEWRWYAPTEVPDGEGRTYRLERQVQLSNCTNRGYAVLEGNRYADDKGIDLVSSYQYPERTLPWFEARPRTIRDTIVAHVCRAAPPAKKS